ncbi:MAG: dipeptidase [Deltaproteobacteria bacterium]|nr:dipeptidase [Deltaproteobacteria bacterium]
MPFAPPVTRRRIGLGLLALLALGAGFGLIRAPGAIERGLNRVLPHDPWAISDPARALHASIPVADLHADPLLWNRDWLSRADRGHTDLPRLQEGGVALQVMTAVTKSPAGQNYERNEAGSDVITLLVAIQRWPFATWSSPFRRALHQAQRLEGWAKSSDGALVVIRNRTDLRSLQDARTKGSNTVGAIFGIEGAHALDGEIENLAALEALGLRVVGLTHFFDNRVGGSLHGVSGEGLTPLGHELVEQASLRRMLIDVAHASPQMVRDVLALSERPVILSHGGFKGICDSARNLDDDLMREIALDGGLIGVGFWAGAICDFTPRGVVRAIRYGIDLLGVDHIALGSDYDGGTSVLFDASELAILTQTMLDEGFSEEEIRKVMGGNSFRFFATWLP